jgi:hypothetical protein
VIPREAPAVIVAEEVGRWLELDDDLLAVVPLVVAVANRLPGPPVWLMIVAPPSSGKSDVIMGLSAINGVHQISTVTPKTFASGMKMPQDNGRPPSLLTRLRQDGKWLLTVKDFGTIQSLPPLQRNPIYGQLGEIYDGRYDANFGTGVQVKWSGKLGMLVGATLAVDRQQKWSAELGERFVQFRPSSPEPSTVATKALGAAVKEKDRREALGNAYTEAFAEAKRLMRSRDSRYTKITPDIERLTTALAIFVAEARRPVQHDRFTRGYEALPPEGPARLVKVFVQLHTAAVVCYAGDREAAARLVSRIAVDSVPGRRGRLLRALARSPAGVTAPSMGKLLECDTETARRELEDLVIIGLAASSKPIETTIYKASTTLLKHARSAFPDREPVQALQKLFDLPNTDNTEGEREERVV